MTLDEELVPALAALDACDAALAKLDAQCCEPGRSPRMKTLAATLADARNGVGRVSTEPASAEATLLTLEEAGAQVGRLEVGCCAPNRLPLYARILEGLTTVQLTINRALDRGH